LVNGRTAIEGRSCTACHEPTGDRNERSVVLACAGAEAGVSAAVKT